MTRATNLDVGMRCIIRMLFILNTTFFMIGILLTAIGSTIHAVYSEFEFFIESYYFRPVEILVSIGVIMVAISVIGYIGTIRKSTLLVNLYAFLLLLLLIFEISAAMVGFVMSSTIFTNIRTNMFDSLGNYTQSDCAKQSWDWMQERLHCCGVDNPYNWATQNITGPQVIPKGGETRVTVPESCCTDRDCSNIYTRGCIAILGKYAADSTIAVTCCVTIALIVQIFGVVFASMLAKAIRRAKTGEELKRQQDRQRFFEQLARGQGDKVASPVMYFPSSTDA